MQGFQELFDRAVALQQEGDLGEAEQLYDDLIARAPRQIEILHNAALVALERGNVSRASELIGRAVEIEPERHAYLYIVQALIQERSGAASRAVRTLRKALKLNPGEVEGRRHLVRLLFGQDRLDEAVAAQRELVEVAGGDPRLRVDMANLLQAAGRREEALSAYAQAIEVGVGDGASWYNYACALEDAGRLDDAERAYREAMTREPGLREAVGNLAQLLASRQRFAEAADVYRLALEGRPDDFDTHNGLANVLKALGQFEEARGHYERALAAQPNNTGILSNLGVLHQQLGRLESALEYYDRALSIEPDNALVHWNRAHTLLLRGEWRRGWREYDWGLKLGVRKPRSGTLKPWGGQSLARKGLLVRAEQGIGDQILFASSIPALRENMEPRQFVIECDRRLVPLFRRSFPWAHVEGRRKDEEKPFVPQKMDLGYEIPIGSLARTYKTGTQSRPDKPYLFASPEAVDYWGERVRKLGRGLKVGVVWRGTYEIPLSQWGELLGLEGAVFISIQPDATQEELDSLNQEPESILLSIDELDLRRDLDGMAGLISAMDVVIGVDSTATRLAGALGTELWLLLPFMPDARWGGVGDDNLWFPQGRLYRQADRHEDWPSLLVRAGDALTGRLTASKGLRGALRGLFRG